MVLARPRFLSWEGASSTNQAEHGPGCVCCFQRVRYLCKRLSNCDLKQKYVNAGMMMQFPLSQPGARLRYYHSRALARQPGACAGCRAPRRSSCEGDTEATRAEPRGSWCRTRSSLLAGRPCAPSDGKGCAWIPDCSNPLGLSSQSISFLICKGK